MGDAGRPHSGPQWLGCHFGGPGGARSFCCFPIGCRSTWRQPVNHQSKDTANLFFPLFPQKSRRIRLPSLLEWPSSYFPGKLSLKSLFASFHAHSDFGVAECQKEQMRLRCSNHAESGTSRRARPRRVARIAQRCETAHIRILDLLRMTSIHVRLGC